jgi:hypothetical protein
MALKDPLLRKSYQDAYNKAYHSNHSNEAATRATLWQKAHPDRVKASLRKRKYGLSADQYETMLKAQDYRCKICKKRQKLCVDHCHKTGRVRGLLCIPCNGWLLPQVVKPKVKAALRYLKEDEFENLQEVW